jgi:hypothetical protein
MNGIEKGREIVAEYSAGDIYIYLYKGTHYTLWDYDPYLPSAKDLHTNDIQIFIQ